VRFSWYSLCASGADAEKRAIRSAITFIGCSAAGGRLICIICPPRGDLQFVDGTRCASLSLYRSVKFALVSGDVN
jgi:hypothetical protein